MSRLVFNVFMFVVGLGLVNSAQAQNCSVLFKIRTELAILKSELDAERADQKISLLTYALERTYQRELSTGTKRLGFTEEQLAQQVNRELGLIQDTKVYAYRIRSDRSVVYAQARKSDRILDVEMVDAEGNSSLRRFTLTEIFDESSLEFLDDHTLFLKDRRGELLYSLPAEEFERI